MTKIKYTFIIPAYNSELVIENCIKRICSDIDEAKLKEETEILIVENGSKDNTTKVSNACIKKYKENHIALIHSDKGVSRARNEGIKYARGTYLIFVDSDDTWLLGALKKIEDSVNKEKADIYAYSFLKGTNNQAEAQCSRIIHDEKTANTFSTEEKIAWFLSKPTYRMQVWSKVFDADLIKKNKIKFNESLRYSEDSEFLIRCLLKSKKIQISSQTIYKYVLSPTSVMRTSDSTRTNGYICSMEESQKIVNKSSVTIIKAFSKYVLSHLNIIFVHDVFDAKRKQFKNKLFKKSVKEMKNLFEREIFKESMSHLNVKDCLDKTLMPQLFYKIHIPLLSALVCYVKSYINMKKENK